MTFSVSIQFEEAVVWGQERSGNPAGALGELVHVLTARAEIGALAPQQYFADGGPTFCAGLARSPVDPEERTLLLL